MFPNKRDDTAVFSHYDPRLFSDDEIEGFLTEAEGYREKLDTITTWADEVQENVTRQQETALAWLRTRQAFIAMAGEKRVSRTNLVACGDLQVRRAQLLENRCAGLFAPSLLSL